MQWPEGELARLIFHELAHQVAYAPGDTTFNESFATAVERIGSQRWLAGQRVAPRCATKQALTSRAGTTSTCSCAPGAPGSTRCTAAASPTPRSAAKAELYAGMRADYEALKRDQWGGYKGYDRWFATANNAALGAQAAYDDQVARSSACSPREGSDFDRFYAEVRRLAALAAGRARRRDGAVPRPRAAAGACRRARNTGVRASVSG